MKAGPGLVFDDDDVLLYLVDAESLEDQFYSSIRDGSNKGKNRYKILGGPQPPDFGKTQAEAEYMIAQYRKLRKHFIASRSIG